MDNIAGRLTIALKDAGLPVSGVVIGSDTDKATWRVIYTGIPSGAQETLAASTIAAFDPASQATIDAERTALATATSRQKDVLAHIAWVLRRTNNVAGVAASIVAWNALTPAQKKTQVLAAADEWRDLRVFIEQNL